MKVVSSGKVKVVAAMCAAAVAAGVVGALVVLRAPEGQVVPWPPAFRHSKVATTMGGWHATTRATVRLVFPHEGKWLVFRGNPDTCHFSRDGVTWTAVEAKEASRSHLIRGGDITTVYTVMRVEGPPKWVFDQYVVRGKLADTAIRWENPVKLDTRASYYPDLQQTTDGYYTMTGRAVIRNEKDEPAGTEVLWKRTVRPDDISAWEPDVRCIHHVGDHRSGDPDSWKKIGSTAHENLALEDGGSCVIAMMTSGGVGRLLANLHDGERWGTHDIELATGMSTWAGTDRRMCAVFDPKARTIHLAYVDGAGGLWYRSAKTPYAEGDWSTPVRLQPFKTFTTVLSLDTSRDPVHVYVLFGKTLFENRGDLRSTYGELYLQRLDGETWTEAVLVSEPGTAENWYPNMNGDVSRGIGVLYLKGAGRVQSGKPPLDIMFASTGAPRTD